MSSDDDEITEGLRMVRRGIRSKYGVTGRRVKIYTLEDETIRLPFPGCGNDSPAAPNRPDSDGEIDLDDEPTPNGKRRVTDDILLVLKEVGHNLTTTRLLSELSQRELYWSDRTVSGALAKMVDDGTLFNEKTKQPRGYGLPEWDTTSE